MADESERSNTIYKKDVQAAMDSGKETPPASQEDYFAESQESEHDLVYVDNDTDFTILSDKSSAQLLKMSAVHKVLAMQLEAKLEQHICTYQCRGTITEDLGHLMSQATLRIQYMHMMMRPHDQYLTRQCEQGEGGSREITLRHWPCKNIYRKCTTIHDLTH